MRLGIAIQLALAIVSAHGFVTPGSAPVRNPFSLHVGQGWDNENFLSSLSGGSDAMDAANEQYKGFSQNRAERQEYLRRKAEGNTDSSQEETEEDPSPQGGSKFKELLKKSQEAAPKALDQAQLGGGPILYNPMEGIVTPVTPAPAPAPASEDGELSVEDQARMFRELMKMQANQPPAAAPAKDKGGKRVGRNRDADTIANTADLYFAQLKRDSTVRTIARYTGDEEKANAVFQDEGVKELESVLKKNPYLKE